MSKCGLLAWFCVVLNVGCGGETLDGGSDPEGGAGTRGAQGIAGAAGTSSAAAKLVFISSERYSADLGGLEGADAKCQSLAVAAGRTGAFKAWLSTTSTPASKRLTHATNPYVLSTGTRVANNWSDLTSGALQHKVDQTESAELAPPNAVGACNPLVFWTGTDEQGSQYGGDCDGWTGTGADLPATLGVISSGGTWSTFCHSSCENRAPIMCLEQ